jgi:hypothetical protein
MECLFHAYKDHCRALKVPVGQRDVEIYFSRKVATHGPARQMSDGAATPYIIKCLAREHGLGVRVQCRLMDLKGYRYRAWKDKRWGLWRATWRASFGEFVDQITLAPAIYCAIIPAHAAYLDCVEQYGNAIVVMALQLYRKGETHD